MKLHSRRATAFAALTLSGAHWPSPAAAATTRRRRTRAAGGLGDGGGLTLTMLPKNLGNPYFDTSTRRGQEGRRGARRTPSTEVGPDTGSPDAQVQYINTAAQQGVDGLIVSANDPTAICDAINEARDAGTKVVTFDSDTSADCRDLFINQATAEGIAEEQLELISEQIGGEGEIAILSASANATNQNAWIDMMEKELSSNAGLREHQAGRHRLRRRRRPDLLRQDRGAAAVRTPNLKGIISPDHGRHRGRGPLPVDSEYKGKVALTGLGHPEPDARVRQGRHRRGVRPVEPE